MVKSTRTKDSKTSASDVALANYLDAMLHTATASDEARWPEEEATWPEEEASLPGTGGADEHAVTRSQTELAPAVTETKPAAKLTVAQIDTTEPAVSVHTEAKIEPSRTAEPEPAVRNNEPVPVQSLADTEAETESVAETDETDLSRWLDNGRPVWAQQRFDCLVFVVDGLKLAVPLILLGNIHTLDRDLTPLFDQPDWFLGLLPVPNGRNLRVVDTARLVMPERYRPEAVDQLGFAVSVYGSDWAFGCHQIEGSISLEPDAVKWRSSRTSRPWLAGTIIDRMCALVDLHEFSRTAFKAG
jgi:purine-binding chemotaxis protein CheW